MKNISFYVAGLCLAGCVSIEMPERLISDTVDAGIKVYEKVAGDSSDDKKTKQTEDGLDKTYEIKNTASGKPSDKRQLEEECSKGLYQFIDDLAQKVSINWQMKGSKSEQKESQLVITCSADIQSSDPNLPNLLKSDS